MVCRRRSQHSCNRFAEAHKAATQNDVSEQARVIIVDLEESGIELSSQTLWRLRKVLQPWRAADARGTARPFSVSILEAKSNETLVFGVIVMHANVPD